METNKVDQLVDSLIKDNLVEYLFDADTVNLLIEWIHEETNIKKIYFKPGLKALSYIIAASWKGTSKWRETAYYKFMIRSVTRLPYAEIIQGFLEGLKERLDNNAAERQKLDEILSGIRPVHNADFGIELSQELKASLCVLDEIQEGKDEFREAFAEILQSLKPQPPLELKLSSLNKYESNRHIYRVQRVPFVGRAVELRESMNFLYSDRMFSWWIMTGVGGMGKSRLALELCLKIGNPWRVGFLPKDHLFESWHDWQPELPTLMIVDYASARKDDLRTIITALEKRNNPIQCPVRLLLLEREAKGPWWDDFCDRGSDTDTNMINQAQYKDPHELQTMNRDDIWKTVCAIFNKKGISYPDKDKTLDKIEEVDSQRRPLFAAMIADAIVAGGDISALGDKEKLLGDYLKREKANFWIPGGIDEKCENLLALATMTGGLEYDILNMGISNIDLPKANEISPSRYSIMTGTPADNKLPPLEPDIIGEYFVLEHLKPQNPADTQRADNYRIAAWDNNPIGFYAFGTRIMESFPSHGVLSSLLQAQDSNEITRFIWSDLVVKATYLCNFTKEVSYARGLYDQLYELSTRYNEKPGLREMRAKAAVNLINYYGSDGDLEKEQSLYEMLESLSGEHPKEPAIREKQAQGAVNLIHDYGQIGDLITARSLYEELKGISAGYPAEPAIRELQAKGAHNLIYYYGTNDDLEKARLLYVELKNLSGEHPDEPTIRVELAKADFNLINDYSRNGDLKAAQSLYDELKGLSEKHPDEPAIRERQASGAVNLINYYGNNKDLKVAQSLYDELKGLSEKHPDEPAIRERQAKGAVNLIIDYSNNKDLKAAQSLYDELKGLSEKHTDEPAIRLEQAKGAFNLITVYGNNKDLKAAQSLYDELKGLSEKHPDEPAIRLEQAKGAFNLIHYYCNNGDSKSALSLYDELRCLSEEYPAEPAICELQAQGAFNLILDYGAKGDSEAARSLYEEVKSLSERYPAEPVIREQHAKGLGALMVIYARSNMDNEANEFLQQLHDLAEKYPDETAISDLYSKIINVLNS